MEKLQTVWVLFDNYPQDNENHINIYSTYEKAKEKFDYILKFREENWFFNNKTKWEDYARDDNYCCLYESWNSVELYESNIDNEKLF